MRMQTLDANVIDLNRGQIEGLPANPRSWTREDLDRLKKSITDTPELLDARGCIVYPYRGRYVVLGGNMRCMAVKELQMNIPCYILDKDLPVEKLKEIVLKDNGSFGKWNVDELLKDYPEIDESWGIDIIGEKEEEEGGGAHQKEDGRVLLEVKFGADEFVFVQQTLQELAGTKEDGLLKVLGYERA